MAIINNRSNAGRSAHNRARALRVDHLKKSAQVGVYAGAATLVGTYAALQNGTGSLAASLAAGVGTGVWWSRKPSGASSWLQGAAAEERTAKIMDPLTRLGWWVGHDRSIPRSKANLDHVAIHPSGRFLVYVDTKAWHARGASIRWENGALMYGPWDKTKAVNTVKWEASRLVEETRLPVVPVICVDGGHVESNTGHPGFIHVEGLYVVSSSLLFHTMALMDKVNGIDTRAVDQVAKKINAAFPPAK